jgi:hypothetical protein
MRTLFAIALEVRFVGGKIWRERIGADHQILHPAPQRSLVRPSGRGLSRQSLANDLRLRNLPGLRRAGDLCKQRVWDLDREHFHRTRGITILPE